MEVTGGFCPTCGTPMFSEAELDNLGILGAHLGLHQQQPSPYRRAGATGSVTRLRWRNRRS
jgi:hypothetical protein